VSIAVVVGTRPEIIKMAPVVSALERRRMDFVLVHTGQHYDPQLSAVFFEELGLPDPGLLLDVGSGTHGEQTAKALALLEDAFLQLAPELVLVEGDTNTVLAGGLAAAKLGIPVGHVEAGLRSYDRRMPEELNRRLTDHLSSLLFAPTEHAAGILAGEGIGEGVWVTGNTVIDACLRYMGQAKETPLDLSAAEEFALVTLHRKENVDDPGVLRKLVAILRGLPIPAVFPAHPRTVARLKESGLSGTLESSSVSVVEPLGYFEFLHLLSRCAFVLTDSGGIQEEVTSPNIRKKAFVLRESTERPEAVEAGFAEVLGLDPERVMARVSSFLEEDWGPPQDSPFGDGTAGVRIVDVLERRLSA
jgi:UDP-N-acetylglucosamine 2-epimerase (non-hydrolysing)